MNPADVVEAQLAAYNGHDIEQFVAQFADDVRVERRDGSVVEGAEALRDIYEPIFAKGECRSEVLGRVSAGEWVVDEELAHGVSPDGPVHVLAAYRVRDGRINLVRFLR